jgi:nitrite reductase/ring-hydroxylating ferredoxin subunit
MLKRRSFGSIPSGVIIALSMLLLLVLTLSLAACSGPTSASTPDITATPTTASTLTPTQNPKPSGPIDAKWIEAQVNGDTVSIPVSEIENDWNTRFKVQATDGDISAMAYILNGVIYVRADICPPCRSQGFTLTGNILDCDSCHTKFKASTGEGVSGACVNYPKASVSYTITDGNVVMSRADLVTAYQNTLKPG